MSVQEFRNGEWRPAVPLPFYGFLHVRCWDCRRRFWSLSRQGLRPARYERHYRQQHIGGDSR